MPIIAVISGKAKNFRAASLNPQVPNFSLDSLWSAACMFFLLFLLNLVGKSLKFRVFLLERDIRKFLLLIFSMFLFLSCAAPFGVYHKVKKNETLYSIAQLYGTSVDNLEKNNNIRDAKKIMPGDYIFVPGVAAPLETGGKASVAHSNAKKDEHKNVKASQQTKPAKKSSAKAPSQSSAKTNSASKAKTSPAKPGKFIWPAEGVVTSKFGARWGKHHSGIDIGCPEGTPIYASAAVKFVFVGEKSGYGLLVIISHSNGSSFTIYAHNSKNLVKENAAVKQGDKIALVGQTGKATGPHLHFEIRIESKAVDPLLYLPKTVP